jgi:hypothetical protein
MNQTGYYQQAHKFPATPEIISVQERAEFADPEKKLPWGISLLVWAALVIGLWVCIWLFAKAL